MTTNVNRRNFLGMLGLAGLASRFARKAEAQPVVPAFADKPFSAPIDQAWIEQRPTRYDNVDMGTPQLMHHALRCNGALPHVPPYECSYTFKRSELDLDPRRDATVERAIAELIRPSSSKATWDRFFADMAIDIDPKEREP